MRKLTRLLLGPLLVVQMTWSAPVLDLVWSLPGLTFEPKFKQYSGYLRASGTKHLHYWFIQSSRNDTRDPLVLWLEGGPGCSSDFSVLAKNGPFKVLADGFTVNENPFSWNKVANMLYIDAPAGAGFSYADDGNYTTSDDEATYDNFIALRNFFRKFPEYLGRDFYIAGASYSGMFVPLLAEMIMSYPGTKPNLKGFLVGNGYSDVKLYTNSQVYYVYYHGMLGEDEWYELLKDCCPKNDSSECDFDEGTKNPDCKKGMDSIYKLVWESGFDPYNLYKDCYGGAEIAEDVSTLYWEEDEGISPFKAFSISANEMLVCRDDSQLVKYLKRQDVLDALHISPKSPAWTLCADLPYTQEYQTMRPQFKAAMEKNLRVMVYNGDFDICCNFLGNEWFVDSLNPKNPKKRRQWYYTAADGTRQNAGFVKEFDQITFATVRGAGHFVPEDKPRPALELFSKFLAKQHL